MKNSIIPQAEYPFQPKNKKQLVEVLIRIHIAVAVFFLLNYLNYYLLPMGNVVSGILSFIWELGILLIAGFIVFSVIFLIVQVFRKDYSRYAFFMTMVVLNIFLLFILPYLVD